MAPLAVVSAQYDDLTAGDYKTLIGASAQMPIPAGGPPAMGARAQVELQLKMIHVQFERLEADIEVFEARATGEFPAITTNPVYDAAGLEAEPGFSMTYDDAVALGRRLQALLPAAEEDSSDGELSY